MKALITGATGFVGSCLSRRLLSEGYEVHIFTRPASNRWRIADLAPSLNDHHVDLRDAEKVEKQVGAIRPEVIFHLATYGGFAFQRETNVIFASNLTGTINLLKACAKVGFERFVNTGSSSEYGFKSSPMKESDLPEPRGDYGVAKVAASLFCRAEAERLRLPVITLRLFSPFGPWDDPKRLIPYVMAEFLRDVQPRLANPEAVRDYVFIDDVVEVYLKTVGASLPFGEIYNIGSGVQHSIADVVRQIQACMTGCPTPIWGARQVERPEPGNWVGDISKTTSDLGWIPQMPLRTGLTKTADWMKERLHLYSA
jgi:nucleoside-diphosphate-sugar epimerase